MKKPLLLIAAMLMLLAQTQAQSDTTIWLNIRKFETNHYIFSFPYAWDKIWDKPDAGQDFKVEFTAVGIPFQYLHTPLVAILNTRTIDADSMQAAIKYVIEEVNAVPDKLFPPGKDFDFSVVTIANEKRSNLIQTRFYRKNKALHYTHYYLVTFIEAEKKAAIVNVTFQYKDSTYKCEEENHLLEYMLRVFRRFELREF